MPRIESSIVVDRSVEVVWRFCAEDHVRNHPRWDPDVELWLDEEEPIGEGTVIRRRNTRYGAPVEGTMHIVTFDHEQLMESITRDGPFEFRGGLAFEPQGPDRTRVTSSADLPEIEGLDPARLEGLMQRSLGTMKGLIESET